MSKKDIIIIAGTILSVVLLVYSISFYSKNQQIKTELRNSSSSSVSSRSSTSFPSSKKAEEAVAELPASAASKTMEEKQRTMEADLAAMDALGLHYDYVNMTLPQVLQAYMDEVGIDHSNIAFSYKDLTTGQTYEMNETQPMTAGSTYKLPLNMLVVDEVEKGNLSMTERFDITHTAYEYEGEHNNYVAAFNGAMTISDMQEYSLLYSENTPAYALAERLGGIDKAYSMYHHYGEGKGELKTINQYNQTTTDYYIQVLDCLWKNKEKYKDILYYIGESFPNEYYKRYLRELTIYQKPGYVREALNVDAIVMEEKPYLIALYTRCLGGSTTESDEISGLGIEQVGQLAYVINEWHRVNMN